MPVNKFYSKKKLNVKINSKLIRSSAGATRFEFSFRALLFNMLKVSPCQSLAQQHCKDKSRIMLFPGDHQVRANDSVGVTVLRGTNNTLDFRS